MAVTSNPDIQPDKKREGFKNVFEDYLLQLFPFGIYVLSENITNRSLILLDD